MNRPNGRPRKGEELPAEEIAAAYHDCRSIKETAARFGASRQSIARALRKAGVVVRYRTPAGPKPPTARQNEVAGRVAAGETVSRVARALGCSRQYVSKACKLVARWSVRQ